MPVLTTEHFEIEKTLGCIIFRAKKGLLLAACDEFARFADQQAEETPADQWGFLVLDVNQQKEVGQAFLRSAVQIQKKARALGKDFVVVNAGADWTKFVDSQGVSLPVYKSLQEVTEDLTRKFPGLKPPAVKVDVNFVNPFIEAAIRTLQVQCSVEAKPGKLFAKGQGPSFIVDIAGVIGLTSKGFVGTIAIAFPKETFLGIMGNMLGEKYTEITKDLEDGAGELLNIIFGQAKVTLNKNNYAVEKAIPTVVRGQNLAMSHLSPRPTIVLPFETNVGPFHIQVSVDGSGV